MKIGIGVTTYNRPDHLRLFKKQLENTSYNGVLHIADDSVNRMGVAFRKNECLRALKDCDYIFLFDDDCFPIEEGWAEWFIEQYKASNQHHFLYLKETGSIKKIDSKSNIDIYNNCGGCFMFLTKECIEKVGAFDEGFGIYGFEHADYSQRIYKAGLNTFGDYLSPSKAGDYIYAMDYDNYLPFNKQVDHKPSMTIREIMENTAKAFNHYKSEREIYIPL